MTGPDYSPCTDRLQRRVQTSLGLVPFQRDNPHSYETLLPKDQGSNCRGTVSPGVAPVLCFPEEDPDDLSPRWTSESPPPTPTVPAVGVEERTSVDSGWVEE